MNNEPFGTREVIRHFHSWFHHSWTSLLNRLTRDRNRYSRQPLNHPIFIPNQSKMKQNSCLRYEHDHISVYITTNQVRLCRISNLTSCISICFNPVIVIYQYEMYYKRPISFFYKLEYITISIWYHYVFIHLYSLINQLDPIACWQMKTPSISAMGYLAGKFDKPLRIRVIWIQQFVS